MHKPEFSGEEYAKWSSLRAMEWGIWPAFLSQAILPILILFISWWQVIIAVEILVIIWAFIRYQYVDNRLAGLGVYVSMFKMITIPISVIILVLRGSYLLAVLPIAWTFLAAFSALLVGGTKIGVLEKIFYDQREKY